MMTRRGLIHTIVLILLLGPLGISTTLGSEQIDFELQLSPPPPEAEKLPSGLITLVLVEGKGEKKPQPSDRVQAHFVARTLSGDIFMNSHDAGSPATFPLSRVFKGWRQGLRLMVEGEKRRLWIPPEIGPPNPSQGPTGETVVFDVELIAILPAPPPPPDLLTPPESATTMPSGLKFRVLGEGTGADQAKGNDGLLISWTGWDESGTMFDSTDQRGKPTLFPLDKMPTALADCARTMVEGESRRCWVPKHLSVGMWAGTPQGNLVFDVQLMRILDGDKIFAEPPKP